MTPPLRESLPVPASPAWGSPPGPPGLGAPPCLQQLHPRAGAPRAASPQARLLRCGQAAQPPPSQEDGLSPAPAGEASGGPGQGGSGSGTAEELPGGGQRPPCSRTARPSTPHGPPFLSPPENRWGLGRTSPGAFPGHCPAPSPPAAPWGPSPIPSPSTTAPPNGQAEGPGALAALPSVLSSLSGEVTGHRQKPGGTHHGPGSQQPGGFRGRARAGTPGTQPSRGWASTPWTLGNRGGGGAQRPPCRGSAPPRPAAWRSHLGLSPCPSPTGFICLLCRGHSVPAHTPLACAATGSWEC